MVKKEGITNATFALPLERIGSKTNAAEARVDNVKVTVQQPVEDKYDKSSWTGTTNSETVYDDLEGLLEYAFDNDPATRWHSNWTSATDKLNGTNTFWAELDLGQSYRINRFSFTPRIDQNSGQVTKADLYIKNSAEDEWQQVAADQTFTADKSKKTFSFETQDVRYIKFVAKESNDGWVAVSEFSVACKEDPQEPAGDISTAVLEYALELAENVDTEGVIDSVVEIFNNTKAAAQAILDAVKAGDTSVTQKQIDDSWKALIEIMQYMSFEKVDKSDLEAVISYAAEIEADLDSYVENGRQEFVDALAHARTVYDDEIAVQDEVEQAWRGLLKAMADLRLKADKDALEDLINEASAIDLSAYTEESAEVFRTALAEAQGVFADETLSEDDQAVVDAAAEELAAARDGLIAKNDAENPGTGADGNNGDTSGKDNASGQNGTTENNSAQKAVKTGDTMAPIAGSAAAVMLAAAAGVIAYRRRRGTR